MLFTNFEIATSKVFNHDLHMHAQTSKTLASINISGFKPWTKKEKQDYV